MTTEISPEQNTILVVDDTPTNLQVLFDVLNESGYRVAIAKNGERALARLESIAPDMILLDVMMPGIDGFETCRRLKTCETTQDIPVIFMTALADSVDKVKGLSLGAVDYVTKPIQTAEVLARIKVHLQMRHLTKTLEQQVEERTIHLSEALDHLKQSQLQLVQSEKMSTLGQLVAGLAHEINNPVNFIYGNLKPAEAYINDLLDLIRLFRHEYPDLTPVLQTRIKEIELDFLQKDLLKLLSSMKIGTGRIQELVLSLRSFSRLDEAEMKPVDIHTGIDSTLLIVQNRLKECADYPAIKVIKDYGQLPVVECYASQLNQAFMNIINNAIDALEDTVIQGKITQPHIRIKTEIIDQNQVRIVIADNGPGISHADQAKLFDAFFTTKPIGKGTGLGLSISYQIITEKHQGTLTCHSSPGDGTEFWIEIPTVCKRQPKA